MTRHALTKLSFLAALFAACWANGAVVAVDSARKAEETLAKARPGATVLLRNGVYADFRAHLRGKGTTEAPVTFAAETPGQVLLTGSTRVTISGEWLTLRGMVFDQAWGREVVSFDQATHCRMADCAFINRHSAF